MATISLKPKTRAGKKILIGLLVVVLVLVAVRNPEMARQALLHLAAVPGRFLDGLTGGAL